jgi:hypothetical protein
LNIPVIVAAPLFIAAIVMAVRFVGCSLDETGLESPQPYSTAVIASNPVSFWRLNDPTATTAKDSTGASPGTYENVAGVTVGVAGLANTDTDNTAASFSGGTGSPTTGGGYISVAYSPKLNPATQFTVEALVNPSAIGNGDVNDFHAVISSRDIEAGDSFGYILYLHGSGFEAWVGDGTGSWPAAVVAAGAVVDGGPYYVAMTYDGSTLKMYVNPTDTEAEIATNTEQFAQITATYTPTTKNALLIGAGGNEGATPKYDFPGVIQDVAVYNDVLPFATIQSHFSIAMTGFST